MKWIVLDIDGVLNSEAWFDGLETPPPKALEWWLDPAAVARLNAIGEGAEEELAIVLSTSWVPRFGEACTREALSAAGVMLPVRGVTPRTRVPQRAAEIRAFLELSAGVEGIVILEDALPLGELEPWVVRTRWERGLEDGDVARARSLLECPPPAWCGVRSR